MKNFALPIPRYLVLSFFLAAATILAFAVSSGGIHAQEDDGTGGRDHQGCSSYSSFVHNEDDGKINWGIMVLCSADTYKIVMSGRLAYWHSVMGRYIEVGFIDETCNTYICIERSTYNHDHVGYYRIENCYSAESTQSSWPWGCDYDYFQISD